MEKSNNALWVVLAVACLLLGGLISYAVIPNKTISVPNNTITEVEKLVYVNSTVEVPVVKIVEKDYLGDAEAFLISEFSEQDDLLLCNGHDYDESDVTISKTYDDYSVTKGDSDNQEVTVDFKVKLKYKESDLESCTRTLDASVFYEEDEDPVLEYSE